ncbi:DsbE family thiol:disulfide interchange protein [Undibacterium sp. Ji22W]|uniref:DsbE family thiol:disulfide interchange protein n=1 Tax=Undibacterium sp. Ji22W TaxID=3413038 RepID=UPI003BF3A9B9
MKRFILPLGLFCILVIFLGIGLRLDPREVPSPLIGKAAPNFELSSLHEASRQIKSQDMLGQVWLLNVWASWCVSCRQEHPVLMEFSKTKLLPIIGLDYKDGRDEALVWLNQFGNPYQFSLFDYDGRLGIDFGVYGVPESFLIDKKGVIQWKHIGPLTPEVLEKKLRPLVERLNHA